MNSPLLLDVTLATGQTVAVSNLPGGLAGLTLLGLTGPAATVEISTDAGTTWAAVTYPHTLAAGQTLRLTRTDTSAELTTLRATLPDAAGGGVAEYNPDGYLRLAGTTSPTWPGQAQYEALRDQVANAAGYAGYVALSLSEPTSQSVSGTRTTVQATGVRLSIGAAGRAVTLTGVSLPATLTADQISSVTVERDGEVLAVAGGVTVSSDPPFSILAFPLPLLLPPGAALVVTFTQATSLQRWSAQGASSNAYATAYLDAQGQVVAAPLAAALLSPPQGAYGQLAADSMRVVRTPSELRLGEFEVLAAAGGVPELRFMNYDGQAYRLPFVAVGGGLGSPPSGGDTSS